MRALLVAIVKPSLHAKLRAVARFMIQRRKREAATDDDEFSSAVLANETLASISGMSKATSALLRFEHLICER